MITYRQEIKWIEDGFGEITALLLVSDEFEGLFVSSETSILANIFSNDPDVSKKATSKVGGKIENEITLEINQARVHSTTEKNALDFCLAARGSSVKRFCALYLNTTDTPLATDALFTGMLQTEFESDDSKWSGSQYSSTINPISKWKFKAKPYSTVAFDNITAIDLIEGNTETAIPGLWKDETGIEDLTWETANVSRKQGYFHSGSRDVYVDKLVNLNVVLRKLADNLCIALENAGYGTITISFNRCTLDGKYHPTRWNHAHYLNPNTGTDILGSKPRFVWREGTYFPIGGSKVYYPPYNIYSDDYVRLVIDPDGTPTEYESPWVSYRLFKALDMELQADTAKDFRWTKYKNFDDIITKIAIAFGIYVTTEWTSSSNLNITYISRQSFKGDTIYLKTATKSTTKYSPELLTDRTIYTGRGNYYTIDGLDEFEMVNNDTYKMSSKINSSGNKIEDLILTISPTLMAMPDDAVDDSFRNSWIFPDFHNVTAIPCHHLMYNGGLPLNATSKSYAHSFSVHTAIYLKVDKYIAHPDAADEADTYWTPAAALTVNQSYPIVQDVQYNRLSDYLNRLSSTELDIIKIEKNIDNPSFCGYSLTPDNTTMSWKNLKIGSEIILDGISHVVNQIKWSFKGKLTSLGLIQSVRYGLLPTTTFLIATPESDTQRATVIPIEDKYSIMIATGEINEYCVLSLCDDGTVQQSYPNDLHIDRIHGIAMNHANDGEEIIVKTAGIINLSESFTTTFTGKYLYLRDPSLLEVNYSTVWWADRDLLTENLLCIIATILTPTSFEINKGFPEQEIIEDISGDYPLP